MSHTKGGKEEEGRGLWRAMDSPPPSPPPPPEAVSGNLAETSGLGSIFPSRTQSSLFLLDFSLTSILLPPFASSSASSSSVSLPAPGLRFLKRKRKIKISLYCFVFLLLWDLQPFPHEMSSIGQGEFSNGTKTLVCHAYARAYGCE